MSIYEEIKVGKSLPVHANYHDMIKKMIFWEESIEVNEKYFDVEDPNGNPILKRFTCEEELDFDFRRSISSPRNYMFGILNKYLSTIFKSPQVRLENEFYSNVDLLGSSISDFMAHKTWEAAVYGASYFQPDSTSTDPNLSEAAKRQIGIRPFFRSIETFNVVNWSDYLGHLQECIVRYEDSEGNLFAIYYDQENMARIDLDSKNKVTNIEDLVPHGYSFIPIIRLLPFNTNESFVAPGSLTQMGINNLISLEKTELFSNTFTRFFLKGIRHESSEDITKITWGTNRIIMTDSENASITPLGADVNQAESIRKSIATEENNIYRQYHLSSSQTKEFSSTPSGYSLVISMTDFNNICSQFVNCIERAERQAALLFNEAEGLNLDEEVTYSREFIQPSKEENILQLRDIISLDIDEDIKRAEIDSFKKKFYNI